MDRRAVRRYVRDAGPLLDRLNQLTRADCTTRNTDRARRFAALQDELEERIARLAEQENLEAMRPPLDGAQVMEHLGMPPGPAVGEALAYLLDLRMERGPIAAGRGVRSCWMPGRRSRASPGEVLGYQSDTPTARPRRSRLAGSPRQCCRITSGPALWTKWRNTTAASRASST